jgi:hypothetical protein
MWRYLILLFVLVGCNTVQNKKLYHDVLNQAKNIGKDFVKQEIKDARQNINPKQDNIQKEQYVNKEIPSSYIKDNPWNNRIIDNKNPFDTFGKKGSYMIGKTKTVSLDISIKHWDEKNSSDVFLPPNQTFDIVIDYPLSGTYTFVLRTGETGLHTIDIINAIVHIYKNIIYVNEESEARFGVWGHDIRDLHLEAFEVNFDLKNIKLNIGS